MTVRALRLEDLYSIAMPTSTSMSPDGSAVAYSVRQAASVTDS